MLYQLTDGRVVEISTEDYLDFTDEELNSLLGYNYGDYVSNPMYGSVIRRPGKPQPEDDDYSAHDIPDIPPEERFKDQDDLLAGDE